MRVACPSPPIIRTDEFPFVARKEVYSSKKEERIERTNRSSKVNALIISLKRLDGAQRNFNNETLLQFREDLSLRNGTLRGRALILFRNKFKTREGKAILSEDEIVDRVNTLVTGYIDDVAASNTIKIKNDISILKIYAREVRKNGAATLKKIPAMTTEGDSKSRFFSELIHSFIYDRQL